MVRGWMDRPYRVVLPMSTIHPSEGGDNGVGGGRELSTSRGGSCVFKDLPESGGRVSLENRK